MDLTKDFEQCSRIREKKVRETVREGRDGITILRLKSTRTHECLYTAIR